MFSILRTRSLAISLFFALSQQLIVASSTLWIVWLSDSVVSGQISITALVLFILSLSVVYIPSTLMNYFTDLTR